MEGLRRGLGAGAPFGRVSAGPARWRGRARDEGPGGERAEGGGEAMVVIVRAGALWCERCGLLVSHQCVLMTRCEIGNREVGSSRECWLVGWWFLSQSKVPNKKLVLEVARACSGEGVPRGM